MEPFSIHSLLLLLPCVLCVGTSLTFPATDFEQLLFGLSPF
jgi:hypothetical protein